MAANSTSTGIFNELFYLYMVIALLVGGLVIGWLFYILIKYRARPGMAKPHDAPKAGILPAERGHPLWSYVMALVIAGIMFGLAFGTISAVTTLEEPPEEGFRVDAVVWASQFSWTIIYEGDGGVPLERLRNWTLPVDTPIVAEVKSRDVWHNFALTEFRIRIDAVPGQTNHIWWQAKETGDFYPVCVQLCGTGHADMRTSMHIVTMDEWKDYVAKQSAIEYGYLADDGQQVNATFDGASFTLANAPTKFNATKTFAVHVTNAGSTTQRFELEPSAPRAAGHGAAPAKGPSILLEPGASAHLYAAAASGVHTLKAPQTGATIELTGGN